MEKKIIAIALVMIMMIVVLVGCNKSEVYVDEDGNEHLLALDEEGNTMLNDNGRIVVYATEADGEIKEDKDGEPITAVIDFPTMVVGKNSVETPDYKLSLPDKWKSQDNGEFIYKENENVSIKVEILELDEYETLDNYMNDAIEAEKVFVESIKQEYDVTVEDTIEEGNITLKGHFCYYTKTKITKDDRIVYYVETINFENNGKVYKASYCCKDGSYEMVSDSINFFALIDTNLVTKENKN